MLPRCRQDMRPWFHSCTKARPQGPAQHHNDCTGFACPKAVFGVVPNPSPCRRPGTAAYTVLYGTLRSGWISTGAPHSLRRKEKTSEFSSASPHAHCKLPGLSQSYSLSAPAALPAIREPGPGSLGPSWFPGWMGTGHPVSATGNPAEVPVSLYFRKILCGTFLSRTAMLPCCEWPQATLRSFRVHHAIAWEIAKWLCSAASVSLRTSLIFSPCLARKRMGRSPTYPTELEPARPGAPSCYMSLAQVDFRHAHPVLAHTPLPLLVSASPLLMTLMSRHYYFRGTLPLRHHLQNQDNPSLVRREFHLP